MKKWFICLVCITLCQANLFCFSFSLDSSYQAIKKLPPDTSKVRALISLSGKLASDYPQKALSVAREAVVLSSELKFTEGMAWGFNKMGHAFERYSFHDSAFHYLFLSHRLFSRLKVPNGEAEALFYIGNIHEIIGRFDSAAFYLFRSLQMADSLDNTNLQAKIHRVIGDMLMKQNRLEEALYYLFSGLRLAEVKKDNPELIARTQENIALVYIKKEMYKMAETYFFIALNIYTANNVQRGIARVNLNLATLRQAEGKYREALSRLFYALAFYKKINHSNGIAESLLELSRTYMIMKNDEKAIDYALQTLAAVQNPIDKDIELTVYRFLEKIYRRQDNYQQAYHYLSKASALHDSLFSESKESTFNELKSKYKAEKNEETIRLLNRDNTIKSLALRKEELFRNNLITASCLLLAIGLLALNYFRLKKKIEKQQAVLDERKRISSDMHDDLGSNLSTIAMLSSAISRQVNDEKHKNELEKIHVSAKNALEKMSEIVWAMNPKNDKLGNLLAYIRKYAVEYFETTAIECKINFKYDFTDLILSGEQRRNIFLCVKESLHNVVKHSGATTIEITYLEEKGNRQIIIQDNGKGIDSGEFGQRKDGSSGYGLHSMKQRMEHIKGSFEMETRNGTTIRLGFNNLKYYPKGLFHDNKGPINFTQKTI